MSAELPWRYRIVPACWEWERFDADRTGGVRGLRTMIGWHRGRCAVCGASFDTGLGVDCDHDAGAVRGLLCDPCAGAESRSHAKVFRSYRRLHPTMLLGLTVSSGVLDTGFWRRWSSALLRTSGYAERRSAQPEPPRRGGGEATDQRGALRGSGRRRSNRSRRMVLDSDHPERFRASLRRDAPDLEQTDRMRMTLYQALDDIEDYASTIQRSASSDIDG